MTDMQKEAFFLAYPCFFLANVSQILSVLYNLGKNSIVVTIYF